MTTDDLDVFDFAAMDAPTFATQVGTTLVLTPAACFTGVVEVTCWQNEDHGLREKRRSVGC